LEGIGFAVIAAGVIVYGLVSRRLQDSIITAPMVFVAFGLLVSQTGLGLVDLDFGHGFVHGLVEVTLILVLFSDAARIDLHKVRRGHNLPLRLLLIGMPLTIVAGTLVGLVLPLGLTFWQAALLAAILAPTDAALGQAVVSSPRVPARVRQALNIESGLNDGIALPMVLLLACLAGAANAAGGDQNWVLFGAKQVVLGPIVMRARRSWGLPSWPLPGRRPLAATASSPLSLPGWCSATWCAGVAASSSSSRKQRGSCSFS
jgi:NhaP-type Na+/H+ or K+/H+ antiporter